MKIVEEYMQMPHKLELAPDGEVGFVASFAELPGCLTCGNTIGAVCANAIDVKSMVRSSY